MCLSCYWHPSHINLVRLDSSTFIELKYDTSYASNKSFAMPVYRNISFLSSQVQEELIRNHKERKVFNRPNIHNSFSQIIRDCLHDLMLRRVGPIRRNKVPLLWIIKSNMMNYLAKIQNVNHWNQIAPIAKNTQPDAGR